MTLRSIAFCFLIISSGCGDGSSPPGGDGQTLCSPATCSGCCLGNLCTSGKALSACGRAGEPCIECAGGEICQDHLCIPASAGCSSANCDGCCVGNVCKHGTSNASCGKAGGACVDCAATGGVCSGASRTCLASCTPICKDKCKGADDGCGGRCPVNDCPGCCVGTQCVSGLFDTACGKAGGICADCTRGGLSGKCAGGACSSCVADCRGKCKGASDGCGGSCANSTCVGCCVDKRCATGDQPNACGSAGGECSDCSLQSKDCVGGKCGSDCVPNCANKCKGEKDDCGGVCPRDTCQGCCDGTSCQEGTDATACGKGAAACAICAADYQGYKWKCEAGACVKDTPTGASCSGKTDGTVACTDSNKPGKCWGEQCCTGCYDQPFGRCWNFINGMDDSCGIGGGICDVCDTLGGISCVNYRCVASSGPCAGKQNLAACETPAGVPGVCASGTCCTTCYHSSGGAVTCAQSLSSARCGQGGAACSTCEAYEVCNATWGLCTVRPDAQFEVKADRATLKDLGRQWDSGVGAAPDPYLGLVWDPNGCSSNQLDLCSAQATDTFTPQWDYLLAKVAASKLMGEHCLFVLDADGANACSSKGPHEVIGQCLIQIDELALLLGDAVVLSCTNPNDKQEYVTFLRLSLSYTP